MKPCNIYLRCFAKKENTSWHAFCIDLNLSAEGDSLNEAREKLHSMIGYYVQEAFCEDKDHIEDLFPRPSPFSYRFMYHALSLRIKLFTISKALNETFLLYKDRLPLIPAAMPKLKKHTARHCY